MSDKCPNCDADNCAAERNNIVATVDEITICRLRAQLRAYEGSLPLDEQRELQVLLRQQGNELERLRGEVARLTRVVSAQAKVTAEADRQPQLIAYDIAKAELEREQGGEET